MTNPRRINARLVAATFFLIFFLTASPAPGITIFKSAGFKFNESTENTSLRKAYDAYVEGRFSEAFGHAKKAVELNDAEAWDFLGWLHESGRGTARDLGAANDAYKKAQEGGVVEAAFRRSAILFNGDESNRESAKEILEGLAEDHPGVAGIMLGEAYVQGLIGGEPDYDAAIEWWTRAAEAGQSGAYLNLARLRGGGYGFPERADPAAAIAHLAEADGLGDDLAMAALGAHYLTGPEGIRDTAKGLEWLNRAAEKNVPDAHLFLGRYHAANETFTKAREHYRHAADAGNVSAQVELGILCRDGLGGQRSAERALELFKSAAAEGDAAAAHHAGAMMLAATDEEKRVENIVGGYRFVLAAAAAGRPEAQDDLAAFYLSGRLGAADPFAAATWLDRAAKAGLPAAQHNLAGLFELGVGVERHLVSAFSLYVLATNSGHAAATTAVGRFYVEGAGVEKSLPRAWAFFKIAAERGDPDGARLLGQLNERLTPAQLEQARKELDLLKNPAGTPVAAPGATTADPAR